jgi:hypothetical protein
MKCPATVGGPSDIPYRGGAASAAEVLESAKSAPRVRPPDAHPLGVTA